MPRDEDLIEKNFPEDNGPRARGIRTLSLFAVAIVVIFIAAIGYVYIAGDKAVDPNNLPLITENNPPEKTKPADPGGMEIPHQDASVYDHLDNKQAADQPEKLLPAAEAPMAPAAVNAAANNPGPNAVASSAPTPTAPGSAVPTTTAANIPNELPSLPSASAPAAATAPDAAPAPAQTAVTAPTPAAQPATPTVEAAIPPAPASPAPAQADANSPTNYRIQLGAVRDEAVAQTEWARMQKKYGDQLKDLNSSFTPVSLGDKGTFLRIQAGPLTREDAEARCAKLKLENQACLIVKAAQ